jgi:hypothetical protein
MRAGVAGAPAARKRWVRAPGEGGSVDIELVDAARADALCLAFHPCEVVEDERRAILAPCNMGLEEHITIAPDATIRLKVAHDEPPILILAVALEWVERIPRREVVAHLEVLLHLTLAHH